MALTFTAIGGTNESTSYTGNPTVGVASWTNGRLYLIGAYGFDYVGATTITNNGIVLAGGATGTVVGVNSTGTGFDNSPYVAHYYVIATNTTGSATVAFSFSSNGYYGAQAQCVVAEVTGYRVASHQDGSRIQIGLVNATSITTSTITTLQTNSILYGAGFPYGGATTTSSDLTWTNYTAGNGGVSAGTGYKTAAAIGNFTGQFGFGTNAILNGYILQEIREEPSGTAHTAAATGTGTATGTAAMSNARTLQASATGTATGTAAASNQRTLAASATGTATGTAAMLSTQAMSASATATATGTAAVPSTVVVTINASGTITAVGTAGSTVTPQVTFQGNGTVIADGSAAMAKTMQLGATATATATSNAGMTHTFYVFKPPTREISPISLDPYFQLVGYFQGLTLVRRGGVWSLVQNKQQTYLDQCEYVFPGGRENRINGTEKTVLESAGYTVETRTS